jgi:hypothetical protein
MKTKMYVFTGLAIALFLFASCTSTKMVSTWKDDKYEKGYLKKVMVVGVSQDSEIRSLFERTFAEKLKERGVDAYASVAILPGERTLAYETIKNEAVRREIESILVTKLMSVEEKKVFVQKYDPITAGYHTFGTYYGEISEYSEKSGHYLKETTATLNTGIYDTATENVIWRGTSETIQYKKAKDVIDSLCNTVIVSLRMDHLLK